MNQKDFKSFIVKGKIASVLWMPIVSIGGMCFTLYALFAWIVKGTFVPSLIFELVLSVAILLILQLCIVIIDLFFEITFNSIEYEKDVLTIHSFMRKTIEINVKSIAGYKIVDGSNSSPFRTMIIRHSGQDFVFYEKWHTSFSELENLLAVKKRKMNDDVMDRRHLNANGLVAFYFEKKSYVQAFIDALVLFMFAFEVLESRSGGEYLSWSTFLYPIYLILRLSISSKIESVFCGFAPGIGASALFIAIYGIFQLKFIGIFLCGKSHGKIAFELAVIVIIYLVGELFKYFVFSEYTKKVEDAILLTIVFAVVGVFLMKISAYGAGAVLQAVEPTYENVTVTGLKIKSSHTRYHNSYYHVQVVEEDGKKQTYQVRLGAYKEASDSMRGRVKTTHSLLGYDVKRLEIEGYDY